MTLDEAPNLTDFYGRLDNEAEPEWPIDYSEWKSRAFSRMNSEWGVVKLNGKVRFVETKNGKINFYSKPDFMALFDNRRIDMEVSGKRTLVSAAALWMREPKRREFEDVTFCPACLDEEFSGSLNLFTGYAAKGKEGDWSLLRTHIFENTCRGNEEHFKWLMAWMAQLIQQPSVKLGSAVVLKGTRGVGKSKLADWLQEIIGPTHAMAVSQPRHVVGNFNAHLAQKLLVVSEEATWAGDKQAKATLQDMITRPMITLEKKGIDAVAIPNFTRLFFISNDKWVVPAGEDERRYFVLEVGAAQKQNTAYFKAIDEQMKNGGAEAMMYELSNYDWSGVDLRNPPKTEALRAQQMEGLDLEVAWWMDVLNNEGLYETKGIENVFHELRACEPTAIPTHIVFASATKGLRGTYQEKSVSALVGKLLTGFATKCKLSGDDGKQTPTYVFLPLVEMRRLFEETYEVHPWPKTVWPLIGSATEV